MRDERAEPRRCPRGSRREAADETSTPTARSAATRSSRRRAPWTLKRSPRSSSSRTCAAEAAPFFPTGRKASFIPTPDKIAKPIYLDGQRRRVGAGYVQGPRDHAEGSAPADRGLLIAALRSTPSTCSSTSAASTRRSTRC